MEERNKIELFRKILDKKDTYPFINIGRIAERYGMPFGKFLSLRRFIEREAEKGDTECQELINRYYKLR